MKKISAFISILIMAFSLVSCAADEVSFFCGDITKVDGFIVSDNRITKNCFVGNYEVSEQKNTYEITIPDEYNGMPINRLGGYYGRGLPCPFRISLSKVYMNAPEGSKYSAVYTDDSNFDITEPYMIQNVVIKLYVGKNISKIVFIDTDDYYPHINDDNSITFYHPVFEIECSKENQHFYSKNGKLYDQKNDNLIEDFDYTE